MDEDGYNFGVPESTTVGTSLGTDDCDGVVGTGVLSITVFAGFTISAKPTKSGYLPTISSTTATP